jgi:putative acyl-CoA dehydrogenase
MPRLLRDSPLNSIWEGSGNVIALDALRAMAKEPASVDLVFGEIELARGADARFDAIVDPLRREVGALMTLAPDEAQAAARSIVERLAVALQGSLVLRHSPAAVADAFVGSRVAGFGGRTFGAFPAGASVDARAIVERHRPRLVSG